MKGKIPNRIKDIDIDNLKDALRLTPDERLSMCFKLMEMGIKINQHIDLVLENDHPNIYSLS